MRTWEVEGEGEGGKGGKGGKGGRTRGIGKGEKGTGGGGAGGGEEGEGGETSNVWIGVDRRCENWRSLKLAIPRERGAGKETWGSKLAGN